MKDTGRNAWPVTLTAKGCVFLLIALCFLAYFPSFSGGFLVDDYKFLEHQYQDVFKAPQDFFIKIPPGTHHYAPLYYLTNTFLFNRFPARPDLFRLIIWLTFLMNVLLFFKLLSILANDRRKAFVCCALFAVHPIHAFYLHMLSANFVFFCALFLQASLLCVWEYITSGSKKPGYYFASLFFFMVSLLFFEAAALYPLYLLLFLRFIKKLTWAAHLKFILPFLALAIMDMLLWTRLCGQESNFMQRTLLLDLSFFRYTATVTQLICWYISRLVYPEGLVFIYNLPVAEQHLWLWAGINGLILLSSLFFLHRCHKDIKSLAFLWFFIGCFFVFPASMAHAYMGLVIEAHWLYFSSIGAFLLLTLGLLWILDKLRPRVQYAVLGLLVLYCLFWTQSLHLAARSEKSYCEYWLDIRPKNLIPLITLSKIYAEENRLDEAVLYAQQAVQLSRNAVPKAYENLAAFLTLKKDYAQAKKVIQEAAQQGFNSAYLVNTRGVIAVHQGDVTAAEQNFMAAIKKDPHYLLPRLNLAKLYRSAGQNDKALQQYKDALRINPDKEREMYIKTHIVVLYLKQHQLTQYHAAGRELLADNPQLTTYLKVSRALELNNCWPEARTWLKQAMDHYSGDKQLARYYREFMIRFNAAQ